MTVRSESGPPGERRYALAFLGAHLSFIPIFALLLPRRVAAVAPHSPLESLSLLLLVGGIVASLAHIAAGRWSDRWLKIQGNRRGVIGIGLAVLCLAQISFAVARTMPGLVAAMVAFQIALNLMFAPLGALLADHVYDARKGRVAGMLGAALPLASVGTGAVAFLFPRDGPGGFLFIAITSAFAILPLIARWPFGRVGPASTQPKAPGLADRRLVRVDYLKIWGARLLVQMGAAFVFNYFFLYLVAIGGSADQASRSLGTIALVATATSVASAILAGTWSDRVGRRKRPLILATLAAASGLLLLASKPAPALVLAAYVLFQIGLTAFLSVDSALVAQLLSRSSRRGELLGLMNLTNTIPAIAVPAVALGATSGTATLDWSLAFLLTAALAGSALLLVSRIRTIA